MDSQAALSAVPHPHPHQSLSFFSPAQVGDAMRRMQERNTSVKYPHHRAHEGRRRKRRPRKMRRRRKMTRKGWQEGRCQEGEKEKEEAKKDDKESRRKEGRSQERGELSGEKHCGCALCQRFGIVSEYVCIYGGVYSVISLTPVDSWH